MENNILISVTIKLYNINIAFTNILYVYVQTQRQFSGTPKGSRTLYSL